jgi:diguanylate cyclase (GGDEF)-like protein
MLDDPVNVDNPLRPIVQQLINSIQALERRLDKISVISDHYHAQLKSANERLEEAAHRDLLTGLSNRRDMIKRLTNEMNRIQQTGQTLTILLVDVDHFKQVNDTFGHLVGDQVLADIADMMRSILRTSDLCARWGGEEFLLLLPDTDSTNAKKIAERLRQIIMNHAFTGKDFSFSLTISIGGASSLPAQRLEDIIQAADTMLYQAKKLGRNSVQFV